MLNRAAQPKERSLEMHRRRIKKGIPWGVAFLLILTACAGDTPVQIAEGGQGPWMIAGNSCVREDIDDAGAVRRIINRADPELCGRKAKPRSRNYVRVIPPAFKRDQ